jgi:hypothetical protein
MAFVVGQALGVCLHPVWQATRWATWLALSRALSILSASENPRD